MEKHTKVNSFDLQLGTATKKQNIYDKSALHVPVSWSECEVTRRDGQPKAARPSTCDTPGKQLFIPHTPGSAVQGSLAPSGSRDNSEFTETFSGEITLGVI